MVRDIRSSVMGLRLANVYDINEKTYLFKFATPGVAEKIILLLESGIRFHTTKYARDKSDMPSPFAMKLRKYIRTKRLEDVRQLGSDRVVDFKFGSSDVCNHIILELYANGNIVLTDSNFEILALLRSHQFEEDVAAKVGEIYPMAFTTTLDTPNADGIKGGVITMTLEAFGNYAASRAEDTRLAQEAEKKGKAKKMTIRQLLLSKDSGAASLGGEIIDHCLLHAGIKPSMKIDQLGQMTPEQLQQLQAELVNGPALLDSINIPGQPGFVLYEEKSTPSASASSHLIKSKQSSSNAAVGAEDSTGAEESDKLREYMEFVPRRFHQHDDRLYLEFPSFDEAVDEYFCKVTISMYCTYCILSFTLYFLSLCLCVT